MRIFRPALTTVPAVSATLVLATVVLGPATPAFSAPPDPREAACTVSNTADDGAGSLRELLADAACDSIGFAAALNGQTIAIESTLVVDRTVSVTGPGPDLLTVSGGGTSRVFDVRAAGTMDLSGLTLTGGAATGAGGGILNAGTVRLSDGVIDGNTATSVGGGIQNTGTLTVTDSTVSGNSAGTSGGGINNHGGATATLTDSTVSENTANIGGGGLVNDNPDGIMTIAESTITGNTARLGGGIVNDGNSAGVATLTMTAVKVHDNAASAGGGAPAGVSGGGLYNLGVAEVRDAEVVRNHSDSTGGGLANFAELTLSELEISRNTATVGGGIRNGGALETSDSTLRDNDADGDGGGVHNTGTASFIRSTVDGNTAESGGGIADAGGTTTVTMTTVSHNEARASGGGIAAIDAASETTTLNSTVSGNRAGTLGGGLFVDGTASLTHTTITANSGSGIHTAAGAVTSVEDSIVSGSARAANCGGPGGLDASGANFADDGTCLGFEAVTAARLGLGGLSDNGAPTLTHPLLAGSVARDSVLTEAPCPDTDQRGVSRPQGPRCDAGAYEAVPLPRILVQPAAVDFGELTVGDGRDKTVRISNIGAGDLTVSAIEIVSGSVFAITGKPGTPLVIPPGGSITVTLTFAPGAAGSFDAILRVTSDSPLQHTVDVPLTGTATPNANGTPPSSGGEDNGMLPSTGVEAPVRELAVLGAALLTLGALVCAGASERIRRRFTAVLTRRRGYAAQG
ncbi:choice-of-anchor Q domain-containing protein [Phytomonospora sp. NPDC050363]|uniref:choice-of-anchor Q domain-containing protein n=1 Tax=Phytomonospora sp. NPDC050363 TaxID=3155642 RepID=UPI0033F09DBD